MRPSFFHRSLISGVILFVLAAFPLSGQHFQPTDSVLISEIQSLKANITNVLKQTNTPALGVAIVSSSGHIWVDGLGNSDLEKNLPANENTVFRLASVSKVFVALSILKLQEEGKIDLNDKVRDIAPEVKFENYWEETDPVRIVHLLNHTTGWDEIHAPELAHNDSVRIPLRNALNFHPHSRVSRWVPGSRNAYSNSGYGVAGYIVEKVSGMTYERFVRKNFLDPLKMNHTTFFDDSVFMVHGAVNYDRSLNPLRYRNVLYRPAGAMNASPSDMANFITALLNRGVFEDSACISESSLGKIQTPQSTPGAKAGLQLGYGLGNFTSIHHGFVFHGHGGSLDGGLAELAYLPEQGIGHIILINATKPEALHIISKLIRDFETNHLRRDTTHTGTSRALHVEFEGGYFVSINPRNQATFFMDILFGSERINLKENRLVKSWLMPFGQTEYFIPVSDTTFSPQETCLIGMVKAKDPLAGDVLYFDRLVMKRIPTTIVFGQLFVLFSWIMLMAYAIVFLIANGVHSSIKSGRPGKPFRLYGLVTLTSLLYISIPIVAKHGFDHYDEVIARPSPLSVTLLITSVLIIISCFVSIVYAYKNRHLSKIIWYPPMILSVIHFLVTVYLISFGVLPVITWS